MLTLPTPVALMLGVCHVSVAVTLAAVGSPWIAAFLMATVSTSALFLRRDAPA